MWGPTVPGNPPTNQLRRSSFSDNGGASNKSGHAMNLVQSKHNAQLHRPLAPPIPSSFQTAIPDERNSFDNGMPYTFDPLFVEDPLSS
jgi:hypothetical protein